MNAKHPLPPFDPKAVKEFDKGNRERQKGNIQAALEHYQKALRIDANFYPALNNMGTLFERQGNHAQAMEDFLKAAKINPDDGEAYINLGHVLYEEGQFAQRDRSIEPRFAALATIGGGEFLSGLGLLKLHETERRNPC